MTWDFDDVMDSIWEDLPSHIAGSVGTVSRHSHGYLTVTDEFGISYGFESDTFHESVDAWVYDIRNKVSPTSYAGKFVKAWDTENWWGVDYDAMILTDIMHHAIDNHGK